MTGVIYQGMLNLKLSYWILHALCRLPQLLFYLSFPRCSRDPDWISTLCLGMFPKRNLEVSRRVCEKPVWAASGMEDLKSLLPWLHWLASWPFCFYAFVWGTYLMFSVLSWMWLVIRLVRLSRHSAFFLVCFFTFLYVLSFIRYFESTITCMYVRNAG